MIKTTKQSVEIMWLIVIELKVKQNSRGYIYIYIYALFIFNWIQSFILLYIVGHFTHNCTVYNSA